MKKTPSHVELDVPRFGEFARQHGIIRSKDVSDCLAKQRLHGGRIGELMVRGGYLAPAQVSAVLRSQAQWAARMRCRDLDAVDFPLSTPLSLCLPCFNEEQVIGDVLLGATAVLPEFLDEFEIVVVDDGSADRTAAVVESLAAKDERIRLVRHKRNCGYGAAVSSALRAARGEWICFTDGDGQFNPLDLPQLLVAAHEADVVLGYRHRRADNLVRRFNALSWKKLIHCILGVQVRDLDCAFKLFPRWVVESLNLSAEGACISAEIIVQCVRGGLSICEVPVNHFSRAAGKPTGANVRVIAKAFRELPALWQYRRIQPGRIVRPATGGQTVPLPLSATKPASPQTTTDTHRKEDGRSHIAYLNCEPVQNGLP
ncbi:MAG: glycosyltransferase family 2 protein [Planctomycetes bacterium]|nr:glycosyltransferase family 2 protein [Planctomycetota bacterium]